MTSIFNPEKHGFLKLNYLIARGMTLYELVVEGYQNDQPNSPQSYVVVSRGDGALYSMRTGMGARHYTAP